LLATFMETLLFGAAFIVMTAAPESGGGLARNVVIVLLALAMGLQNAIARCLAVSGLTTTVLTVTLTGLAADSALAGGNNPNAGRQLAAIAAMLLGATIGALLISKTGISAVLALVLALLVLNGIVAYRYSSSSAAWTAGK
jgi:uncharacterized membrane protein YoaK (UPF0700 family)